MSGVQLNPLNLLNLVDLLLFWFLLEC